MDDAQEGRGRNYTPGERAIMILGVRTGMSLDEINRVLRLDAEKGKRDARLMPAASYADLTAGIYKQWFDADSGFEWLHVHRPHSRADIKTLLDEKAKAPRQWRPRR